MSKIFSLDSSETIKNSKRLKITTYADNLQAKESEKEGE